MRDIDALSILRLVVFGTALVLLAPGLSWSYLLLRQQEIDLVARVAVSFGLSMVLVPLAVFWLNLTLGVGVTLLNVVLITLTLSAIPPAYLAARAYQARHQAEQD